MAATIVRRARERKRDRKREWMPRVTELTVCQPNTGSTVQLPLLFIPPVDSPAGIYASERHPANTSTPYPLTYPPFYPDPPAWYPHTEINNLPHSLPPGCAHFFISARREIYKNIRATAGEEEAQCDHRMHECAKLMGWFAKCIDRSASLNLRFKNKNVLLHV